MPPPPAFSIIVPLHNESEDIGPTCEALLRLEPEPEMVFVDDGSTDDTVDVLQRYLRRPSMRLIRLPANRGQGVARNAAVRAAAGDVVVFVDADVLVPSDFLRRLSAHYEQGADYVEIASDIANLGTAYARFADARHQWLHGGDEPIGWSQAFSCRRELAIQAGLFPEAFPTVGEDGEFVRRLEKVSPRRAIDRSIVVSHVAPDSLRGFWRQWYGRGHAIPFFRHQTQHMGWLRLLAERLAATAWSVVRVVTVIPVVLEARALTARSARGGADFLPFFALSLLHTLAHRTGEWRGLIRLGIGGGHAG